MNNTIYSNVNETSITTYSSNFINNYSYLNDLYFVNVLNTVSSQHSVKCKREKHLLNIKNCKFAYFKQLYPLDTQEICTICLEYFISIDAVSIFPCELHIYHVPCLNDWIKKSNKCPLCKFDFMNNTNVN
jgi:hypothetical protein